MEFNRIFWIYKAAVFNIEKYSNEYLALLEGLRGNIY